jgi:hypothetical protein
MHAHQRQSHLQQSAKDDRNNAADLLLDLRGLVILCEIIGYHEKDYDQKEQEEAAAMFSAVGLVGVVPAFCGRSAVGLRLRIGRCGKSCTGFDVAAGFAVKTTGVWGFWVRG